MIRAITLTWLFSGQRSDEIRARFEDDVVSQHPDVVVIVAGVNDVYQGREAAHVNRELAAMYERADRAGIKVVAGSILPFDTATADQNARMREINEWIAEQARGKAWMAFADTRAAVASASNPDTLRSSADRLHPDADGYRRMAGAIGPAIEALMYGGPLRINYAIPQLPMTQGALGHLV